MALTIVMLIVLIVSYLLMIGLVNFAERVIERPQLSDRGANIFKTPANPDTP